MVEFKEFVNERKMFKKLPVAFRNVGAEIRMLRLCYLSFTSNLLLKQT